MIVELFVKVASSILSWLLDTVPALPVPDWVLNAPDQLEVVAGYGRSLSNWVPTSLIGPVLLAVLAAGGIGLGLKLGRVVLSLFTAGGGSAG